jgi:hypothetical protein
MKRLKQMNRQLSLSFGTEPPTPQIPAELDQQQREEIANALADLLLNLAITNRVTRGEDNDK